MIIKIITCRIEILIIQLLRLQFYAAEALCPFITTVCGQFFIMQLIRCDTCLQLSVITRSLTVRKILLPMLACVMIAPAEQLFIIKRCGRTLIEYNAVLIGCCLPCAGIRVILLNEIVKAAGRIARIGDVISRHSIDVWQTLKITFSVGKGNDLLTGRQHTRIAQYRYCHIAPPIGGGVLVKRIDHFHMNL